MKPILAIVDDSLPMRKILRRTVQIALGDEVEFREADNGQSALALLAREPVDLVLTDVNMPVMGGIELLRRIRADARLRATPVVVVTSDGTDARRIEVDALEADAFVRKPVSPEALREVLQAVMARRPKNPQAAPAPPATDAHDEVGAVVREVVGVVLESAFVFPTDLEEDSPLQPPLIAVRVGFDGARRGELFIQFEEEQARELAENLIESSDDESLVQMAREIANVICGRTLGRMFPAGRFDLDAPEVTTPSQATAADVVVQGERGLLSAHLSLL